MFQKMRDPALSARIVTRSKVNGQTQRAGAPAPVTLTDHHNWQITTHREQHTFISGEHPDKGRRTVPLRAQRSETLPGSKSMAPRQRGHYLTGFTLILSRRGRRVAMWLRSMVVHLLSQLGAEGHGRPVERLRVGHRYCVVSNTT